MKKIYARYSVLFFIALLMTLYFFRKEWVPHFSFRNDTLSKNTSKKTTKTGDQISTTQPQFADRKDEIRNEPLSSEAIADVFRDNTSQDTPQIEIVPSSRVPAPDQGEIRAVDKNTLRKAQEEFAALKTPEEKTLYLNACMKNNRYPILRAYCYKEMTLLDDKLASEWEPKLNQEDRYLLQFIE